MTSPDGRLGTGLANEWRHRRLIYGRFAMLCSLLLAARTL